MSINNVMLSGVAGLIANSSALGAISDNIANVNTVGYKQNVTQFDDLVTTSDSAGAYNPGGVQANVTGLVDQQGQLTATSSPTDLAISGSGFFAVTPTSSGTAGDVTPSYTRAGNFTADSSGYLKNSAGFYLQGWVADSSGVITTDPSDLTKLSTINVTDIGSSPDPSTEASLNVNLDAGQAVSSAAAAAVPTTAGSLAMTGAAGASTAAAAATAAASADPAVTAAANTAAALPSATPATVAAAVAAAAGVYSPTYNSMAAYTATSGASGVAPDYSTQVTIYDAQGGAHTTQIDFLKSATANQWNAEMVAVPASDVKGVTNGVLATGVVTFNPDGTLDAAATTFAASDVSIGASTATTGLSWATSLGLPAQSVNVNLSGVPASVTQFNTASVTNSTTVDGGPAGTLSGVKVQANGDVVASFSNGASKTIAQVAIGTFTNADGLQSASGDVYSENNVSGSVTFKQPGQAGAGEITPSTLESSTVDLSSQFTGLIITQRAYQASSKIITTADQMLQALLQVVQ
jgi:flagellar hook protein FlgE